MTTIDFQNIRSSPKSKSDSFEELSVQLFQNSCCVPKNSTFYRLRGDGGDGGVEAYFITPDDTIIGIQAKYFFKLGASQFQQIKHSLERALSNYPSLSEYWIYIPFDLSGRVTQKPGSKSEQKRFTEWKQCKEEEATAQGSSLRIQLCSTSDILNQIHKIDAHGGMRRYWFDELVLTHEQIENGLNFAEAFAGPRYTAALDVVTDAQMSLDFFGGVGDFQAWRNEFLLPVIKELRFLQNNTCKTLNILEEDDVDETHELINKTIDICEGWVKGSQVSSECTSTKKILMTLIQKLKVVREKQEEDFNRKHGMEKDTPNFRQVRAEYYCSFPAGDMDEARKWVLQFQCLYDVLTRTDIGAMSAKSLLLVGPAGIGKTHAIVSAAKRRLRNGGCSAVVFGHNFGETEPWEVIRSNLGFGSDIGRETLMECLNTCAEHTELPFVIFIDALNESPRNSRWKDKLPELLEQCKSYSNIKICVSTRDTYRDLVVDERFTGFAFNHTGLEGREFEAIEAFATHYGIDAEISPFFVPELSNPLFLHLVCQTLKAEGHDSLDVPLSGFVSILGKHLNHCDKQIRERLPYSNPKNLVKAAMSQLADTLNNREQKEVTWEACSNMLRSIVGDEIPSEKFLSELEHEGLVILSAGSQDSWLVRFGYQRFGDFLRAINIVESVRTASGVDLSMLSEMLKELSEAERGVLEAIAVVLPEETHIEITELNSGVKPAIASRLFIDSLLWRSRKSVTHNVSYHVDVALRTPKLWESVYEMFFRLSLVPEHPLNAINWLSPFLRQQVLVHRDAFLTLAAYKSFDSNGAIWSLINATLHADVKRWPTESRKLATFALGWLTSCSNRKVRDRSGKALTRIIAIQPDLARDLVQEFSDCDDDYILESISQSIYSACLLETTKKEQFLTVVELLLTTPVYDSPNILIRETVLLLRQFVEDIEITDELRTRLGKYPSKVNVPEEWPTRDDAKPLMDLEGLPPNMDLVTDWSAPDFWRYQVERKIEYFDIQSAGISSENLACWMMVETLNLGYPGLNDCALHTDNFISHEFGTGRAKDVYAERLGKKYYWILLHRLIGILTDNVSLRNLYDDWQPNPVHFWSLDVRKADFTDVRDISPSSEYPDRLIQGPSYEFPDKSEDVKAWVRTDDFTPSEQCLIRTSESGDEWVVLTLSVSDDDRCQRSHLSREPYHRVHMYIDSMFVCNTLEDHELVSLPNEVWVDKNIVFYRGYFAEYPHSVVFDQLCREQDHSDHLKGMDLSEMTLSREGNWEYDFSQVSEQPQSSLSVPNRDIVKVLKLNWDRQRGWIDSNGHLVAFESSMSNRHGLFMLRSAVNEYLKVTKLQLVYRWFANRLYAKSYNSDNPQIDLSSKLWYLPQGSPIVLTNDSRLFYCEDGPKLAVSGNNFPFISDSSLT